MRNEALTPQPHDLPNDASRKVASRSAYRWQQAFFFFAATLSVLLVARLFFNPIVGDDHYTYLAYHLVRGDLTVDTLPPGYSDVALWQGHKYLPFGLLPGIITIPFLPILALTGYGDDAWIGAIFTALNIWLFWKVLGQAGVVGERRNWALLLFFGGTVYLSAVLMGGSWFFAHVIATTCLLLAIFEMLGKGRLVLVGLFIGLAGMTRVTMLFALPFFLWLAYRGWPAREDQEAEPTHSTTATPTGSRLPSLAKGAALMALGLAGPVVLVALYNYARFGSPLESGYAVADLYFPVLDEARSYGLFSLVHIPKNLFMLLLQGPLPYPGETAPVLDFPYLRPSAWGMGIFFTSPALLYIFRAKLKEPLVQACWLGVVALMIPLITYYGVGLQQFGYRYALDFTPLLVILAARGFPSPLTVGARVLVIASVLVNLWGVVFLSRGLL